VTCAACRRLIVSRGLQERSAFPDVPTFTCTPEGHWRNPLRPDGTRAPDGCHLVFTCPVCGQRNLHGGAYGKPGYGDGHRAAHCLCWPRGYYLREARA